MNTLINVDINQFIANRCKERNISCKNHIVTVFGDVVSQHGNWIWLSSLIKAIKPLGFSDRLVRTSVFRLVQDDWLQTEKVGRCSYYAFTDTAHKHYQKAARRIYANKAATWDGNWLLVLPTQVPDAVMPAFKRQLHWLGFSSLTSGLMAHPSLERQSLTETLSELELQDKVVVFSSKTLDPDSDTALKDLVIQRWSIKQLEADYMQLIASYRPIYQKLRDLFDINDQQSFLLRTLLIHEYRRILLKDHELPQSMLPNNWAGYRALELVKSLYQLLAVPSNRFIGQTLEHATGHFDKESPEFWQRFK